MVFSGIHLQVIAQEVHMNLLSNVLGDYTFKIHNHIPHG